MRQNRKSGEQERLSLLNEKMNMIIIQNMFSRLSVGKGRNYQTKEESTMKMKKVVAGLLIAAMAAALTACGESGSGSSGGNTDTVSNAAVSSEAPDKKLTIAWQAVTTRLDPMYIADQDGFLYANMIYDCLVESNHQGEYEPALAESWEVGEDGMTWTFHLREGVKFQNGQDFTSADVVCSYQRVLDDTSCNMYIDHWSELESVTAVDDYTVEIKTLEPFAMTLASVGWTWIIPHEAYEQYGDSLFTEHREIQCGTGPWMLTEYNEGQNWIVAKNPNCWKPNESYYDEIEVRGLNEAATAVSAHLAGDVQVNLNVSEEMLSMYAGTEDKIDIQTMDAAAIFYYCQYNCSDGEVFADPNARLAFDYAIDRQAIIDGYYSDRNDGIPNGIWCSSTYGYDESYPSYEYDPEKAKEYLTASGYDGSPIVLNVKTTEPYAQEIGLAISENLNAVGFNCSVEPVEPATMNTIRADGNYDIFMVTQIHADGDAYSHLAKRVLLDAHHSNYVDEELNDLISTANREIDTDARLDLLHQINAKMRENPASQSNIVTYFDKVAADKGIVNLDVYPDNVHYYRYVTYEASAE